MFGNGFSKIFRYGASWFVIRWQHLRHSSCTLFLIILECIVSTLTEWALATSSTVMCLFCCIISTARCCKLGTYEIGVHLQHGKGHLWNILPTFTHFLGSCMTPYCTSILVYGGEIPSTNKNLIPPHFSKSTDIIKQQHTTM